MATKVEQTATNTGRQESQAVSLRRLWVGVPREFALALCALAIAITVTVVPAPFLIDDLNYLVNVVALRDGHVSVANTVGLPPSSELTFFDPIETRAVT